MRLPDAARLRHSRVASMYVDRANPCFPAKFVYESCCASFGDSKSLIAVSKDIVVVIMGCGGERLR